MSSLNRMSLHHPEAAAAIDRDLAMVMESGAESTTVDYDDVTENHFIFRVMAAEDDTEEICALLYQTPNPADYNAQVSGAVSVALAIAAGKPSCPLRSCALCCRTCVAR
jgi:hypothetical protein